MLQRPYVVLDFETTGLGPADRVIEIAAARFERDRRFEFHSLCNPGCALSSFIQELTGLTDADLAGAPPTILAIRRLMAEVLYDEPLLVAHNASFDLRFLNQELARAGMAPYAGPVLCTMRLSRRLFPVLPSHRLEALLDHWGIHADRHHRAMDDVRATAQLLDRLVAAAEERGVAVGE
ncbi:DNA polymerase III alpha subunit (gram-positive type) [Symbiobacterium terraclitae]|uniref:DNA polymerase III alpha subunit (Gram-positive type) n=1 Tax=Symbiobacterium terraclitae TaxID=557451 RepID=A0ABS4JWP7_9FIRM|nr:3'-5' exonuclease [Symbiobacterium terraclitae]MBP2019958.1 DNA polymerase III alpha subunit (gram-positive type) [Symbiobacterium terraclitae]